MTKDQIIAMAREAGYDMEAGQRIGESSDIELFTRFACLVAAQAAAEEREACAVVSIYLGSTRIAAAIRERK